MDRKVLIGTGSGLLVGFIAGAIVGSNRTPDASRIAPPPAAQAPAPQFPQMPPQGGMPEGMPAPGGPAMPDMAQMQQRIRVAEAMVAAEPKNVQAWIALGNDYFDTRQFQKSVDAYGKALALDPNNPDVLTDQGVMYRELKQYNKAIDNFEKASKLNPKHAQSQHNLGVIYAEDMKQPDRAIKVWTKIMESQPGTPAAEKARLAIEGLKGHNHP
ncbi:MAG TPA: tetratricopeptide repeat protein [Holophagaceae bacterium]|nr:tetratricopeptide repeat protein [Holophagaceae bacterium]